MSKTIVLDNGGGLIKAGYAGTLSPSFTIPNCLAGVSSKHRLIGDDLLSPTADLTSLPLRRPFDRGYLLSPDLQKPLWDRILLHLLHSHPPSSALLLVEPLFTPTSIQRITDELVFEDFNFHSLCVADAPSLVHLYETSRGPVGRVSGQCSLVVDSGFSFTHAAPVVQNFTLNYGVRRMDLGGKALTNYLKELVSYRAVNVMDETLIVDDAKEKLCFVSLDVARDLRLARQSGKDNPFKCTYVLPDGVNHTRGFVKDTDEAKRYLSFDEGNATASLGVKDATDRNAEKPEDKKRIDLTKNEFNLTNERFLVPEMIFRPADLGMNQAGLAECIVRSVNACHPHLHPVLFENIILTGGNTLFPRFAERLELELRPLVPDDYRVKITTQEDPITGVWRGGSLLASSPGFESMCVTKAEYEEVGSARSRRRFLH